MIVIPDLAELLRSAAAMPEGRSSVASLRRVQSALRDLTRASRRAPEPVLVTWTLSSLIDDALRNLAGDVLYKREAHAEKSRFFDELVAGINQIADELERNDIPAATTSAETLIQSYFGLITQLDQILLPGLPADETVETS